MFHAMFHAVSFLVNLFAAGLVFAPVGVFLWLLITDR